MARSIKKGPFIDDHLQKKVTAMAETRGAPGDSHMVAPFNGDAGDGRSHYRRA